MQDDYVGRTVGSYLIEKQLGDGGMAQVYKARHIYLDTLHAIKILRPDMLAIEDVRKRFLDEAKIQAKFKHHNIVAVTDIIAEPGIAALVVEYVEGVSLAEYICKSQLDEVQFEAIKRMFCQLLHGLQFVHLNGIIHRDIKPDNILIVLGDDGLPRQVKLLDFGIAKILTGSGDDKAKVGTPHYMSPEQILSPSDVDIRSDIFSLGVTLYEVLTGEMPFDGEDAEVVQDNIVRHNYKGLPKHIFPTNTGIAFIVNKCLEMKPENRFQTCQDLCNSIYLAQFIQPVAHTIPPFREQCDRGKASSRWPPGRRERDNAFKEEAESKQAQKPELQPLPWYHYPAMWVANAGCTLFVLAAIGIIIATFNAFGLWAILICFFGGGLCVWVIACPWQALSNFFVTGCFHLDGGPFGDEAGKYPNGSHKPSRTNWWEYNTCGQWFLGVILIAFGMVVYFNK